jgi:hypothetical protein
MTRRVFECKLTDFFRAPPPIFWKSWDRAKNQSAGEECLPVYQQNRNTDDAR